MLIFIGWFLIIRKTIFCFWSKRQSKQVWFNFVWCLTFLPAILLVFVMKERERLNQFIWPICPIVHLIFHSSVEYHTHTHPLSNRFVLKQRLQWQRKGTTLCSSTSATQRTAMLLNVLVPSRSYPYFSGYSPTIRSIYVRCLWLPLLPSYFRWC